MGLSKIQKEIIETSEPRVVVNSRAAAGKTCVLTERVKYLLEHGAEPSKMVVITFTNLAAGEMRERLGELIQGVHLSTIHAYANYLLTSHGIRTNKLLSEENFDELFPLIERHPEVIEEVDYLLMDEAQDTDDNQFRFLIDMINPKSFFVVGDTLQSIYRFRGACPENLFDLTQRSDVVSYDLNENYRNGENILAYAKSIMRPLGFRYFDNSIAMSKRPGRVVETSQSFERVYKIIEEDGNWGDWFVLTRTNNELENVQRILIKHDIPCDTFKRSSLTNDQLSKKMNDNTVKVLTIHTAKGLEAKNVIVMGAKYFNTEERSVSYVAATRAKELLVWMKPGQKNKTQRMSNWE